ncbi:deleted in malignant brain tumors 1 protein-like [Ambystoma mexicanum]|uniref:deleted in malignant brain tumors 1 protein-like n=1 Tax=Ambystoma mexicanum TaxID=8296 RepID=UPI0037E91A4F
MHVVIDKNYLQSLGYSAADLFLNEGLCHPEVNSSAVIFNISFTNCGTKKEVVNSTIIYSNTILAHPAETVILRQKKLKIDIGCKVPLYTTVDIMYEANDTIRIRKVENENIGVAFSFYDSVTFEHAVTQSPYVVNLNQNVYLKVTLISSDADLEVFVDTCLASPDPEDFHSQTFTLIRKGCILDPSYLNIPSRSRKQARFTFRAFSFLNDNSNVFLRCTMAVCRASDASSRCQKGCQARRKRSLRYSHKEVDVILGPIQIKQ